MTGWRDLVLVAAGGALGASLRWAVSGVAYRLLGTRMPWGTLAVNLLGCLALGLLMELSLHVAALGREVRTLLAVGLLGAFTTFSTFGYETFRMVEAGRLLDAALNVLVQLVPGLLLVGAGVWLARLWTGT